MGGGEGGEMDVRPRHAISPSTGADNTDIFHIFCLQSPCYRLSPARRILSVRCLLGPGCHMILGPDSYPIIGIITAFLVLAVTLVKTSWLSSLAKLAVIR
jgi:hypothetical protein